MMKENKVKKYLRFYSSKFGKEILQKELEFVESKLKDCNDILSIGCGPAFLETRLQRRHPEMNIIALDFSEEMLAEATKSIQPEYGNARHLEFDDSIFDAVLHVTSLEFIENYKKAIEEAFRVLKPKGIILILMLNPDSDCFRAEYGDKNSYIRNNIKHLNVEEIREFVSSYFSIENKEYFLGTKDRKIFDTNAPRLSSLYIVEGTKHGK